MQFSAHLLKWYNVRKRDLPWRRTKEPYEIWISEIILQQTRVDQGLPYYEHFIQKFPTVYSLANASEKEVLKVWQGLGYYSRARNLHHTAKSIVDDYHGIFPRHYDEIIHLKGIGSYTAAAISSICFDEPKAVVDGNVFRVLSRFHGIDNPIDSSDGKKIFVALANEVMDKTSPGEYNQAIMEFGALQCKPSAPDCASCCLNAKCHASNTGTVDRFPVKSKTIKQKKRYFNYIMLAGDRGTFYQKRSKKDIWKHMYEPLLIESKKYLAANEILNNKAWLNIFKKEVEPKLVRSETIEHKLTHQTIKARFWEASIASDSLSVNSALEEFEEGELLDIPIPRLIEKYLEQRRGNKENNKPNLYS